MESAERSRKKNSMKELGKKLRQMQKVVKRRLDAGFHVDCRDEYGHTMLIQAARHDHVKLAAYLIFEKNANVNFSDNNGVDALSWAAMRGNVEVARCLIDGKARILDYDTHEPNPLMLASREGHLELVRYFVDELKTNVNLSTIFEGNTALIYAATRNKYEVVEYLLASNAEVDARNRSGRSALLEASREGNLGTVEALIIHGRAGVNLQDHNGKSALMLASRRSLDVVQCLVKFSKVDVNMTDQNGGNAAMEAILHHQIDILKHLVLSARINVNMQTKLGKTALLISASLPNQLEIARVLVEEGSANLRLCDCKGKRALDVAVEKGHLEVASFLEDFDKKRLRNVFLRDLGSIFMLLDSTIDAIYHREGTMTSK
eukprot:CAMPEP_0185281086 /NCGR_PEP_ID=MMETSP1359-20130426/66519_1 /TAXON_ID=552665 /ORGANISM="Bigelowiella longifila, Strain CCMP242" /LENGTH=374 /DNA_ID=CAMNT_0027876471 /DNA_START=248 /DNA_END=1372 /DNA_ORIENTATION=+